jgi:hypothetical protein
MELFGHPAAMCDTWLQERYDLTPDGDAISANESRRRLEEAILSHIDQRVWQILQLIEAEEKQDLLSKIRTMGGEAA